MKRNIGKLMTALLIYFSLDASAFISIKDFSGNNVVKMEKAFMKNDAEFLRKELRWYKLGWEDYSTLLKMATGETKRPKICSPEALQVLADKKKKIRTKSIHGISGKNTFQLYMTKKLIDGLINNVIENECEKSIPILRTILDQDSFFNLGKSYKIISDINEPKQLALGTYMRIIIASCKEKKAEACLAQAHLKSEVERFEEILTRKAWRKTPEGQEDLLANEICDHYLNWKGNIKAMKEEHEKGKVSGFVNKVYLKEWGDEAYEDKKKMREHMAIYKIRFKKSFSTKNRCIQSY